MYNYEINNYIQICGYTTIDHGKIDCTLKLIA